MSNFWTGFEKRAEEKRAFLGAAGTAIKSVLGTGVKDVGKAFRQSAANWGSGARTGMQAIGDAGRGTWSAMKTTAQNLKPHLNVAGQAASAQIKQLRQRYQQPKPPVI